MLEGRISKAVVVQDKESKQTVLMGYAEYYGDRVNFKVAYDFETLDFNWFLETLREQLAEDLDIPPYRMDIQEEKLLRIMEKYHHAYKGLH
jgi:hypothetical protein